MVFLLAKKKKCLFSLSPLRCSLDTFACCFYEHESLLHPRRKIFAKTVAKQENARAVFFPRIGRCSRETSAPKKLRNCRLISVNTVNPFRAEMWLSRTGTTRKKTRKKTSSTWRVHISLSAKDFL